MSGRMRSKPERLALWARIVALYRADPARPRSEVAAQLGCTRETVIAALKAARLYEARTVRQAAALEPGTAALVEVLQKLAP